MNDMRDHIMKILKEGDLALLSAKIVRQRLEQIYGQDLTHKKKEIDAMLMEALEEIENVDEHAPNNSTPITSSPKTTHNNTSTKQTNSHLSDSSSQLSMNENDFYPSDGEIEPPKKQQKKKNKTSAPSTNERISDDSDNSIENDEELARKIQAEESHNVSQRSRRSTTTQKSTKTHPKKRKKVTEEDGKKKRKSGTSVYSRLCHLSPQLSDVMGTNQMARKDVVKRMWEIIKERNLQDPKNKQWAICDEQLTKVFGRKKFRTFGMMKYLSSQIHDSPDCV